MEGFSLPPDWNTLWKWENYICLEQTNPSPPTAAHLGGAGSGKPSQRPEQWGGGLAGSGWGYSVCPCAARQARPLGNAHQAGTVLCSAGPSHQPLLIFGATLNYEHANQSQHPGQAPRSKESLLHSKLSKRGPIPPLSPHSRGHIPLPTPLPTPRNPFPDLS